MKEGDVFMCIALSLFKDWFADTLFQTSRRFTKTCRRLCTGNSIQKSGDLLSYKLRNLGRLVAPLKTQLATRNFY